jgi:hypothetical protein
METEIAYKIGFYVGIAIFFGVILFAIIKIRDTVSIIKEIIHDTLKKPDEKGVWRFTRTSLTMFSAWVVAIVMASYDAYVHGVKFEVLSLFVGVALGSKVMDGWSKKLDPTIVAPTPKPESVITKTPVAPSEPHPDDIG